MTITKFKIGIFALSLLTAALFWALGASAVPAGGFPAAVDNSDLTKDGVVDFNDLTLFSSRFLQADVSEIDWCTFISATNLDEDLYDRPPQYYIKHFSVLLSFASEFYGCVERSNMNGDVRINARDLMAFSEQYAGKHFMRVDWCVFMEAILAGDSQFGQTADYYLSYYGSLMIYIQDNYECSDAPGPTNPLALKNSPRFLTRIAASRDSSGDYYVTDAKVGSIFIYDSNLVRIKELKGLAKPLGIAVNSLGQILVGNDKRNNVEVYDQDNGALLATFGQLELETPSSILLDSQGNIYVTDTGSNTVYVYDSQYNLARNIGERGRDEHQLRAPSSTWLSLDESELYVLDRLNRRVQVFDVQGDWLRSLTFEGTAGENCKLKWSCWCYVCEIPGAPPFTRLQSMDVDSTGMLHVLDIFLAQIFILNPQTGDYIGSYGVYGPDAGELKTPTSLLVEETRTLVVDGGKNTIEILALPSGEQQ